MSHEAENPKPEEPSALDMMATLREAVRAEMKVHVADLSVALAKSAEPVSLPLLFHRLVGCAHCYLPGVS